MFTCLPPPVRPSGISGVPFLWHGAAAISLTVLCLLHGGQPRASMQPRAEQALPEHFSQQNFVPAIPEIGVISEVPASGPNLRAATATQRKDSVAELMTSDPIFGGTAYSARIPVFDLSRAGISVPRNAPDPGNAARYP